jgi:N6-L-threonylcarbamoyladenine synthase
VQKTIIDILMSKLVKASKQTGIRTVAIAGGVSANSGLHDAMLAAGEKYHWKVFIPRLSYSTDNAAMVAVAGYFKYLKGEFATQDLTPYARQSLRES